MKLLSKNDLLIFYMGTYLHFSCSPSPLLLPSCLFLSCSNSQSHTNTQLRYTTKLLIFVSFFVANILLGIEVCAYWRGVLNNRWGNLLPGEGKYQRSSASEHGGREKKERTEDCLSRHREHCYIWKSYVK